MPRGDVGVLARLEKETRRADRAQQRLSKALQKRDRKRGRAVAERTLATPAWLHTWGEADQAFPPAREANRWCRRLKRATDDEGRPKYYCTELGTDLEIGGNAILLAPARRGIALDMDALRNIIFSGAPPDSRLAISNQRIPLWKIKGSVPLFEPSQGRCVCARFVQPDVTLPTPLILLTDEGLDPKVESVQPGRMGLSRATLTEIRTAASRLLGLSEVEWSEFAAN